MLLACDTPVVINLWFGGVFHSFSFYDTFAFIIPQIYKFRPLGCKYVVIFSVTDAKVHSICN